MPGIREAMNKNPWLGWTVAGIAIVAAAVLLIGRLLGEGPPDSAERRAQSVTIRCTETGEEWEMNRGRFEMQLMEMQGQIDPTKGIPSPYADGRLTGVLIDKSDWEETVARINSAKAQYEGRKRGGG